MVGGDTFLISPLSSVFWVKLSNVSPQTAFCPNHDCSDCKIMELMASLCFGPRLWKKQPTLILIVCWLYDGVKMCQSNQPTNKQRDSGTYNLGVGLGVKIQFIPDDDDISDNQKPQTTTIILTWIVVDSYRIVAMNRSWCWKNCVLKVTYYYISLNNVFNSYVCYGMVLHCIILYSVEQ